jgi:hypothetical protein
VTDQPPAVIPLGRGGHATFTFTWPNGAGGGADLTAYGLVPFEPHEALAGHVTLSITNPPTGQCSGTILWQDDMLDGRVMTFRLRLVPKPAYPSLLPITPEAPLWVEVT